MSIAAYMAIALHDPDSGYYASRDPLGAAGDFITAPEISQIFGELIGACVADFWQRIGRPDPVILAELGPGRGTLMADLLRASRAVPEFHRAMRLYLVEASPVLRASSGAALRPPTGDRGTLCRRRRRAAGGPAAARRQRVPRRAADSAARARPQRLGRAPGRARAGQRARNGAADPCRGAGKSRPRAAGAARFARRAARHRGRDLSGRRRPGRLARRAAGAPARRGPVHRLRLFPEPSRADVWPRCAGTGGVDPRRARARPISAPMSISRLSPRPRPRRRRRDRTVRCRSGTSCSPSAPKRGSPRCRGAPPRHSGPRSRAASRA